MHGGDWGVLWGLGLLVKDLNSSKPIIAGPEEGQGSERRSDHADDRDRIWELELIKET